MAGDEWLSVQFVGGPLDGEGRVHPAMNYRLELTSDPWGFYEFDGQVYILRIKDDPNAERVSD
jgi:hypothetical protein